MTDVKEASVKSNATTPTLTKAVAPVAKVPDPEEVKRTHRAPAWVSPEEAQPDYLVPIPPPPTIPTPPDEGALRERENNGYYATATQGRHPDEDPELYLERQKKLYDDFEKVTEQAEADRAELAGTKRKQAEAARKK
jgi:hypothetical protein